MFSSRSSGYILVIVIFHAWCQGVSLVEFEDAPHSIESEMGTSVQIQCETREEVAECQWYWMSATDNQSMPIVVSTFPAYGNESRSCSVRFKNVRTEQEGLWICGARESEEVNFTLATPFQLSVVPPRPSPSPPPRIVQFAEITQDTEVKIGMPMHLICKTAEPVKECLWSWRFNATEEENPVKRVEPFGDQKLNCDIRFDNVLPEHDGIWTCGARFSDETNFTTARPIRVTIMTEVGFVQLSQDIQVAIGEPVFLRCITNIGVDQCRWTWQAFDKTNTTKTNIKQFSAYGEEGRDCSVRMKNVLEEHAGVWRCEARLEAGSEFNSAPPATITILYPARATFLEEPQDTVTTLGDPVILRCVTSTPMRECSWTWKPLNGDKAPMLVKTFPPFDNFSRDCSVRFKSILREQEGIWGCSVRGPPNNNTMTARLAKLSVFQAGPVTFVQLTQDIHIYPGGPLLLQCISSEKVDQCRWTWQPLAEDGDTEIPSPRIIRQFKPSEKGGRDCTIRVANVKQEQEGIWTCSIRPQDDTKFLVAAPATVTMLQPESVTVALWSSPENSVSLACRLSNPTNDATCHWYHPPSINISEINSTKRFLVHHKKDTGVCTLSFSPETQDLGQWKCGFNVDSQAGEWEMASANLILLTTITSDDKMGWLIGVLAIMVLILTATLITVVVCRCRGGQSTENQGGLNCASLSGQDTKKTDSKRYTDPPTKINFQFKEQPGGARTINDVEVVLAKPDTSTNQNQHIYERVDRYITPISSKSIYENVE